MTSDAPCLHTISRARPASLSPDFATVVASAATRSDEIEALRRMPADLIDQLIDTGVFRLWVAKRYGGAESPVQDLLDAIELAAYHDGSTGWCVMIGGTTALNSGHLDPEAAQLIYGDPRTVTGGFGRPAGRAVVEGSGLRVSGTWQWGSGTSHCTWIGGGVRIMDGNGEPTRLADGTAAPFVYFPRSEVELADNWHVAGLRGTGSVDYSVHDAFVPEGRWTALGGGREPVIDSPLYRFSLLGALAVGVSSVTLGLAGRAIDELIALGSKKPDASSKTLSERTPIQADLAQVDAELRAARAFLRDTVARCWESAESTGTMTDEDKRLLRSAANHAVARATVVVDRCYTQAGGTAVFTSSPLQRIFRDLHTATQHAMTAPRMWEPLGRMLFGLPTSTAQF